MPSDTLVIYSMNKVGRIVPPNKQILRDISLGFYYGATFGRRAQTQLRGQKAPNL